MEHYFLIALFFIVALIYSSVGFGGGSSYLALLAIPLFALPQELIRPTALFCNLIVVTAGAIIFYKEKSLKWKVVLPYVALSVPAAFAGGRTQLSDRDFFVLLALTLIVASVFLWFQPNRKKEVAVREVGLPLKLFVGAAIGYLSGLVSIGGGIFLSPLMHFFRWQQARTISATASVFILVNSIGGLWGQFSKGIPDLRWQYLLPLLGAVFLGGQIGSRLGARVFNPLYIKRITAIVILIAGIFILQENY